MSNEERLQDELIPLHHDNKSEINDHKNGFSMCSKCCKPIKDTYEIKIRDASFHTYCALCCLCSSELNDICFVYDDGKIYCRLDYYRHCATNCSGCRQPMLSNELSVRVVKKVAVFSGEDRTMKNTEVYYHESCFSCSVCHKKMCQGDLYTHNPDSGELLCREDYYNLHCKNGWNHSKLLNFQKEKKFSNSESIDWNSVNGKRARTVLSDEQRVRFMLIFNSNRRPPRKVREALAKDTNLPVRVVQVWFQNQRAREKKLMSLNQESEVEKNLKQLINPKKSKHEDFNAAQYLEKSSSYKPQCESLNGGHVSTRDAILNYKASHFTTATAAAPGTASSSVGGGGTGAGASGTTGGSRIDSTSASSNLVGSAAAVGGQSGYTSSRASYNTNPLSPPPPQHSHSASHFL